LLFAHAAPNTEVQNKSPLNFCALNANAAPTVANNVNATKMILAFLITMVLSVI